MTDYKIICWNMEWLNDLFDANGQIKPLQENAYHSDTTVGNRLTHISKIIHELSPDIIIVIEGPNKTIELQRLFDDHVSGSWQTHIQPTSGSSQCNGIAIRMDLDKFDANEPLKYFDTSQREEFQNFYYDTDQDEIKERYHFERFPLLASVKTKGGEHFYFLGLHLKSKGIFNAYEWSKWWTIADANRKKILAQCSQIRLKFLDNFLIDPATKDMPIIVCGDINDGPGMDSSEKRLFGSGIERLMGNVWNPEMCLKNALFEFKLSDVDKRDLRFEKISTTSFKDPIFNNVYHKSWIDHILYSGNLSNKVVSADVHYELQEGKIWEAPYKYASDHYPVSIHLRYD